MLFDAVSDLPLRIDVVETETLSQVISPEFTRKTTVIHLHGGDQEGLGEDVTYDANEHGERFPTLELTGDWTVHSFSRHLAELDLFPSGAPDQHAYYDYRTWAFESAALDLALRQSGLSLAIAIGREPRPLTFVSSTRKPQDWLAVYPNLRFKLDSTPEWTDEVVAALAADGNVDVVDLKGQYRGTSVDAPADPALYRRVADAFPQAWIEDPDLTAETDALLEPHRDRVTWDAPIHSWADVEALPFPPRCLNSKPSRFGSVERLFEFYDRCGEAGITLYGGGQFELGVGRGQIQLLAAIFHPDGSNDVAPGGYNSAAPLPGLELTPLDPRPTPTGFRRSDPPA